MKRKIRVGSRDSKLAVMQTQILMKIIEANHPDIELELITMKTTGDIILDQSLDKVGGKGLFVKELDKGLRDGIIDISVHSLKDMPMDTPDDLPILSYSHRENPMDALVLPEGKDEIDFSKPFGCSSARRSLQLSILYPNVKISGIRGNVLLRLEKVDSGAYGGTILACAGLIRIGLQNRIARVFTVDEMIPSAGQGILAIQGRSGEDYSYLTCTNAEDSQFAAIAERSFVRNLGGDCSSPIASYAQMNNGLLTLSGLYYDEIKQRPFSGTYTDSPQRAEQIGARLAEQLLKQSKQ